MNEEGAVVLIERATQLAAHDPHAALEYSTRAFQLAPDDPIVTAQHGFVLATAGRVADGIAMTHRANNLAPDEPFGWWALANIQENQGDYEAAVSAAEHAMNVSADDPHSMVVYAWALMRRAQHCIDDRALAAAELGLATDCANRALAIEPDKSSAFTVLGWIAWAESNFIEAERFALSALRLDPHDHLAERALGAARMANGSSRRGMDHLQRAALSDPSDIASLQETLASTSPVGGLVRVGIYLVLVALAAALGGWAWPLLVVALPIGLSGGMILMARRQFFGKRSRRQRRLLRETAQRR